MAPEAGPAAKPGRLSAPAAGTTSEQRRGRPGEQQPTSTIAESLVGKVNAIDLAGQSVRMRKR